MIETGDFTSSDGTKLFFRASVHKKQAIPVVITHGFAEHSGRYLEMMNEIEQHGYAPFAFDLRGHGQSDGKRGYVDALNEYVLDLKSAVDVATARHQAQKVIVLGHSMGGLITSKYAVSEPHRVLGVVLSSPLFGIKIEIPKWKKLVGQIMSKYWPSFSMTNQIDAGLLSHDKKVVEAYVADPLIFKHVCARWFQEVLNATEDARVLAEKFSHPVLLQLAQEDHIVAYEKSREWYDANASRDKHLRVYEGYFHEIYNEAKRDKPITDFLSFILERWPHEQSNQTVSNKHARDECVQF